MAATHDTRMALLKAAALNANKPSPERQAALDAARAAHEAAQKTGKQ